MNTNRLSRNHILRAMCAMMVTLGLASPIYGDGDLIVDGNLGVGTTTPSNKLEVVGNVKITGNTQQTGSLTHKGSTMFHINSESAGNGIILRASTNSSLRFDTGGDNPRMLVDAAGNVGIGTTNPDRKLHIREAGFHLAHLENSLASYSWDVGIGDPGLNMDGTLSFGYLSGNQTSGIGGGPHHSVMTLRPYGSSGNVGIGTTTPGERLDVAGNARISGTLSVTGSVTTAALAGAFVHASEGYLDIGDVRIAWGTVVVTLAGQMEFCNLYAYPAPFRAGTKPSLTCNIEGITLSNHFNLGVGPTHNNVNFTIAGRDLLVPRSGNYIIHWQAIGLRPL